jgi:uncharacterized protein (TIGR01627 family)
LRKLLPRALRRPLKSVLGRIVPQNKRKAGKSEREPRPPAVPHPPVDFGPARLISSTPPVFLTGIRRGGYLGIASAFAQRFGNMKAGFIIFPTWTLEQSRSPHAIRQTLTEHSGRHPNHRFLFICGTPKETQILQDLGIPAVFLSKNVMVSDQIFRPIQDARVEFDGIYNARFIPVKRHELAAAVPRVGYIAYVEGNRDQQFRDLYSAALARNPGHVILNDLVGGMPARMSPEQVNGALARAAVGLILSAVEGSNYASVEYLLAGLPVVSTPSIGGRDVFFDPDYCIVCAPDPAAVREAVATLRARNTPREVIRARTLAKLQPDRERFLGMIDGLIEELGGERRYSDGAWPFGDATGAPWRPFAEHLAEFAERQQRADLAEEFGLSHDALSNVQLHAAELRPIVTAIRERPGCALLVFGCGNDSPFWEKVNRGGTTAFLEDNPRWVSNARAALATATVHSVQYGTRLAEWPRLLDSPSELAMDLPVELDSRRWDVILVDGPAGYDDTQPGRMKSIYAASRLVAAGGRVFVHDCDRPAERAFTSRYLGDERLFVEAKGRATLRGYTF